MDIEEDKIHEAVRDRYAAIAREFAAQQACAASCCCTTSCCTSDIEGCCTSEQPYDPQMLADLPLDVTGLSLGCGDPVTIAGLNRGERVLDLGSGGGIDCFLAARQVGEEGQVIGIDMTDEMLARANMNKEKMGARNVEFRKGRIEALPVEDESVDVVMSNCVINLSPDKAAVFREAFRVLKPGGRVSISDVVTEGEFSAEMRERLEMWAECITGAIDVDRYIDLMREAGFVNIEVVSKVCVEDTLDAELGMPRVFSARIIGHKPVG